jgi:hypothetical protein
MEEFRKKIVSYVASIRGELDDVNRYIHQNPELSSKEYKSSRRLTEALSGHGFVVNMPVAGLETAFVASRSSGAERRSYKGIGPSRKKVSYDNCRGTHLHNDGTGAWSESPSIAKIPIVLNT